MDDCHASVDEEKYFLFLNATEISYPRSGHSTRSGIPLASAIRVVSYGTTKYKVNKNVNNHQNYIFPYYNYRCLHAQRCRGRHVLRDGRLAVRMRPRRMSSA